MGKQNRVPKPKINRQSLIATPKVAIAANEKLVFSFEKFSLDPITISGEFNNHYEDLEHFSDVAAELLGKILPKISSHSYNEICVGGKEGETIHFHCIDEEHRGLVTKVFKNKGFPDKYIEQIMEGNSLFCFSAKLGHKHAARVVCQKIDSTLYLLFIDANHHMYFNKKYAKDSLFYEYCPIYSSGSCKYMPSDCFAVDYLDEKKIEDSMGFSYAPNKID